MKVPPPCGAPGNGDLRPDPTGRTVSRTGLPPGGGDPAVCPHCWMVNPGAFRLCARCGASMSTYLQESGGLRRTAPIQSPVPVQAGGRLSLFQRAVVGLFVVVLALTYLAQIFPAAAEASGPRPAPATQGQ